MSVVAARPAAAEVQVVVVVQVAVVAQVVIQAVLMAALHPATLGFARNFRRECAQRTTAPG